MNDAGRFAGESSNKYPLAEESPTGCGTIDESPMVDDHGVDQCDDSSSEESIDRQFRQALAFQRRQIQDFELTDSDDDSAYEELEIQRGLQQQQRIAVETVHSDDESESNALSEDCTMEFDSESESQVPNSVQDNDESVNEAADFDTQTPVNYEGVLLDRFEYVQKMCKLATNDPLQVEAGIATPQGTTGIRQCVNCCRSGPSFLFDSRSGPAQMPSELTAYKALYMTHMESDEIRSMRCAFNNISRDMAGQGVWVCG